MIGDLSTRRDFTGIDICKFVMAFAVIAIHCRHEGLVDPLVWPNDFQQSLVEVFAIDSILTFAFSYTVDYCQQNIRGFRILGKLIK